MLKRNPASDLRSVSLASLQEDCLYITNSPNTIDGIPSVFGTNTTMILRARWNNEFYATVLIDIEGEAGIYTRRKDSDEFKKQ